ncbi:MAG: class I SAM-dependent methyltransferase [Candidatus Thorarchaeota archaeon]
MPEWDDIFREKGHVFIEPHPEMERLIKIFHTRKVHRILDLGCGTGRHIIYFSERGFQMYGTDASESAIELSKEWVKESNLTAHLEIHRMEQSFPFDDDFFDALISIQVIHHNLISDILRTIHEIRRVVREGGVIFISVPILTNDPVLPEDDWGLIEIEQGTFLPRKGPESGIPHHYFTADELNQVLTGFDILEMFLDESNHRCVIAVKK